MIRSSAGAAGAAREARVWPAEPVLSRLWLWFVRTVAGRTPPVDRRPRIGWGCHVAARGDARLPRQEAQPAGAAPLAVCTRVARLLWCARLNPPPNEAEHRNPGRQRIALLVKSSRFLRRATNTSATANYQYGQVCFGAPRSCDVRRAGNL